MKIKIKVTDKQVKGLKKVLAFTAGAGAAIIVNRVIKNNLGPEPLKFYQKIAVSVGAYAVAGIVADAADNYLEELIDTTIDTFQKTIVEVKAAFSGETVEVEVEKPVEDIPAEVVESTK